MLNGNLLVVGGRNGTLPDGSLVEGAAALAAQAMRNVLAVLNSAGASQADVGRLGIHLVQDVDVPAVSNY